MPLPVAAGAYSMLTAAKQQGLGDLDVAAILAFRSGSGMEEYPWPIGPAGKPSRCARTGRSSVRYAACGRTPGFAARRWPTGWSTPGEGMIVDIHGHITPPELFKKFPMPPASRTSTG